MCLHRRPHEDIGIGGRRGNVECSMEGWTSRCEKGVIRENLSYAFIISLSLPSALSRNSIERQCLWIWGVCSLILSLPLSNSAHHPRSVVGSTAFSVPTRRSSELEGSLTLSFCPPFQCAFCRLVQAVLFCTTMLGSVFSSPSCSSSSSFSVLCPLCQSVWLSTPTALFLLSPLLSIFLRSVSPPFGNVSTAIYPARFT